MSLTSFGVAKLRAAVTAMLKQYDGAVFEVATWCRITRLVRSCAETNYDFLAIRQTITIWSISSRAPWLLSVTESFALPPKPKGGHMPNSRFDLREWLVPPVLMPIFLVLLVAAAMVIQW